MNMIFLLIALCVVISHSAKNYTLFQEINLPNNQRKISFSNDFQHAFLYDDTTNVVNDYRAYDWGNS
jgi:hypothetical protein